MLLNNILENFDKYSNEVAYRNLDTCITYGELYKHVVDIYSYILKSECINKRIVVYGHKEEMMIACFLACSFAGITYVPIDSYTPIDRVNTIIQQVKPDIIFNIAGNNKLKYNCKILNLAEIKNICINESNNAILTPRMKENDTYYIIFTSGTTGVPKGVMITYKNINSFIKWYKEIMINRRSIILNQAAFSFDLSVADIYLALSTGSELVALDKSIQMNFKEMFKFIEKSNAEIAIMTPSFAELLMIDKNFNSTLMSKLATIYFCGEVLTTVTAKRLSERFKNIKIINSYGPTECTVAVTSVEITEDMLDLNQLPIGKSKEDTSIYIVDDNLNVLSEGEIGQILISGDSVSTGYCNVKSDNFILFKGEPAYLTGDIGYYKDGMLWYKCRQDRQIKYRGYRIELSDIEENIYKLKYVNKVMVVPELDKSNKVKNITAFIKLDENSTKTSKDVKKDISNYVPEYMCPKIKLVNNFVLNINGKTDSTVFKEWNNERRNNKNNSRDYR